MVLSLNYLLSYSVMSYYSIYLGFLLVIVFFSCLFSCKLGIFCSISEVEE